MLSFVQFSAPGSFVSPPALGSSAPSRGAAAAVSMSGVTRNAGMGKLQAGYLFPEIGRRRNAYLEANPDAKIISLGIGDTTMPVPPHILAGLTEGASRLGTNDGYSGYGPENGVAPLREKIASSLYDDKIAPDEIFVSDGSKCDIGRLQMMFGSGVTSAVQDPSYPVYVDTSVMMGQTGEMDQATKQYGNIVYMPCNPGNGFFPDVSKVKADVIYFCSPNNPTGAAATRAQLQSLVDHANKQGSIIVFDAAYAPFIRSGDVPKSIFEIDGARTCAIEVNSFSKYAGFTGVRLGWTIVPKELTFADGSSVKADYNRVMSTCFNGASNIVQRGAMSCLDKEGLAEIKKLIDYYMENAAMLKSTMEGLGYTTHGGTDAPYVFVDLEGKSSWDTFSELLESSQVVTIPGAGFGPGGEGFLRLSAFAPRAACEEACERLKKAFAGKK
jgi:LL-diaminopimelate aminotransferase